MGDVDDRAADFTLVFPETIRLELSKDELATVMLALREQGGKEAAWGPSALPVGSWLKEIAVDPAELAWTILDISGFATIERFQEEATDRLYVVDLDELSAKIIGHALLPEWTATPFAGKPEAEMVVHRLRQLFPDHWGDWYEPTVAGGW